MGRHIVPERLLNNHVLSEFYKRGTTIQNKKIIRILALLSVGIAATFAALFNDLSSFQESLESLPIEYFPIPDRTLKEMQKYEKEYQNEEPLSASLNKKTTMLLGIFSTNANDKYIKRRNYIRETYLNTKDPRICKLDEYIRQVELNMHPVCQVPYTFIIAAGGRKRPFDHDDNEPLTIIPKKRINDQDDCTYLNIRENMEDGKTATFFKFGAEMSKLYNIDYINKLDDDTIVSPKLLFEFMDDELPPFPYNRRIFGGRAWGSRTGQVYYGAGQYYFLSSDLADFVSNTLSAKDRYALSHSKRKTEDADMGKFLWTHNRPLKFIDLSLHRFWEHGQKSEEDFKKEWDEIMDLNRDEPRLPAREGVPWERWCDKWINLNRGL